MKGFFGRLLIIDMTNMTTRVETLEDQILETVLGGKGLGTQLLLKYNPPRVDPFSPDNHLIFSLGPVTDSAIYGSCRHGILSKSPLTGFYGASFSGGKIAIPMSRTGYDAFVICGKAENAVWLEISDTKVLFHDASSLWGKDTYETEKTVKSLASSSDSGAMVIGPAGENRVRFAVIENDYWRSAGRTGMGAVMGSKHIKAVVFHGSQRRPFADPDGIKSYTRETLRKYKDHNATKAYRNHGTPMMVALLNTAGAFPTRYWASGRMDNWQKISADSMKKRCNARPKACLTCFMGCGKYIEVQEGRHKGLKIEGPEYETLYAFGGLCLIDQIEEIAYLNDLCDRLGIDTITAGNMAAFAIEASIRGKIKETLNYGNADHVANLLQKISRREGIGALLAEGIKTASVALELEDIGVHVKGMEPAGYDPRILKGMGLAYAVSDRGACHLRSTFYKAELSGIIDPNQHDGKVELFLDFEDRCTLHDCLITCRFYRDFYTWEELSTIIFLTTGLNLDKIGLESIAKRVTDSARSFNIQEGLTAAGDQLPDRFFKEPLETGGSITREEMARLTKDYYRLRGWSPEGNLPE